MKKIYIVGGPGSGKTYISKVLSKKINIPFFELDNIFWKDVGKYTQKEDAFVRDKKFIEIISRDSWVVEGSYYKWVDEGFKRADIIVILKISKTVSIIRTIIRSLRERFNGKRKESLYSLYRMLKWGMGYDKKIIPVIFQKTNVYKDKRIVLRSTKEIDNYIKNINNR